MARVLNGLTVGTTNALDIHGSLLTKFATPRKINGVDFDGSSDITIVDPAVRVTGEPTGIDPSTPTILSFTYGNPCTLTISPVGSHFDFWIAGELHRFTTTQGTTFDPTTGAWFWKYSSSGFEVGTTPWAIDANTVSIAMVYVNTDLESGLLADERHGITMDWATHSRLHSIDGTQVSKGAILSDFAVTGTDPSSNPSVSDLLFSISDTEIRDEDIKINISTLPIGGPYLVAYKFGTNWKWYSSTYPFICNGYIPGSFYIQYNQYINNSWQLTNGISGQFINYYVFATNILEPTSARFVIIPGQQAYTLLADAQAENVLQLDLSDFFTAEFAPLWKLTYRLSDNSNYNDIPGRAALAINPIKLIGYKSSVSLATAPSSHAGLSNRADLDSHPATAISSIPYNGLLADNVQSAINELQDNKLSLIGGILTGSLQVSQLISSVPTGTPPLIVTSNTLVSNLNSELLNGNPSSYYLNYDNLNNKPIITSPTPPQVRNNTFWWDNVEGNLKIGYRNQWIDAVSGTMGPSGVSGTGSSKLIYHSWEPPYDYIGTAEIGSLPSQAVWTIKRSEFDTSGTLLSSYSLTNQIWNNRGLLTYG